MARGAAVAAVDGVAGTGGLAAVDDLTAGVLGQADPRVANGLITWRYHELALELAQRLDGTASWFAFGTWASRTAGRVIRGEQFGGGAPDALAADAGSAAAVAKLERRVRVAAAVAPGPVAEPDRPAGLLDRYLDEVRGRMADLVWAGNRMVFVDLAPPFTALCEAFPPGRSPTPGEIERFLAGQGPGQPPSGRDRALALTCRALAVTDRRQRAQLVATAALQAVRHEQVHLDPYVDAALVAPNWATKELLGRAIGAGLPRWLSPLARLLAVGLVGPFLDATRPLVEELTTRHLVQWSLGDHLQVPVSEDLGPPLAGGPFLPAELDPPRIEEMVVFLAHCGTDLDGRGTAVLRWGDLDQRMRFITNLFCSRFAEAELLAPPFSPAQVDLLQRGQLPDDLP